MRSGLTWETIYQMCDEDGNGLLDYEELKTAVRPREMGVSKFRRRNDCSTLEKHR